MLSAGTFQPALFDQELAEIEADDGVRYILRRNPLRAEEVRASRRDKLQSLRREVRKQNEYLTLHTLARVDVALRKINERRVKLKIDKWVTVSASERSLSLDMDDQALAEVQKLDGCYVLKTDLGKGLADKETVHARYKDLALVERAFRTSKTVELEMRPIHVRLATRTRGHALVVMLGYVIVQELSRRWCEINLTVEEGIKQLTTLCATELHVNGQPRCNRIPEPRESIQELLAAAEVRLPDALACKGIKVATRKKLPENRIKS